MRFSYTDTAVVSSSPTGRHLSTVIRRPCVLMSGWDEHAAELCKVLNDLTPEAKAGDLREISQAALAELRSIHPERRAQCRCADEAVQTSGVFVAPDGTVRAETKQRGVHWRGTVPVDRAIDLLTWAGKGPHTVQQVREKCEELSTTKRSFAGQAFPAANSGLKTWQDYGHTVYKYALEQYNQYEQVMAGLNAQLNQKDEELEHLRKGHVNVCAKTAAALYTAADGDLVSNPSHTFRRV